MCGIVGMIRTKKTYVMKIPDALKDAIYFNRLRGVDALGLFKVDSYDMKLNTIKNIGEPFSLIKSTPFKDFIEKVSGGNQYLVAHNRHATRGDKKNPSHAQPFSVKKANGKGTLTVVHNGTITHFDNKLDEKYPGKTDSETLAKLLASGMPLTDIEAVMWGAWALIWYDSEDESLNFWRNEQRPFGFVYSDETTWFGSEIYSVAAAVDRHGFRVEKLERFPIHEHWKYTVKDGWDKKVVPIKKRSEVKWIDYSTGENCDISQYYLENLIDEHNEELRGVSKSGLLLAGLNTTSAGTGGTKVQPYVPTRYDQPNAPKLNPAAYASKPGKTKEKWVPVSDALGFQKGDILTFCLSDFHATGRPNQVVLDGQLITYTTKGGPACQMMADVTGMVGKSIEEVDRTETFWEGRVTSIQSWKKSEKNYRYKFHVKDIKDKKEKDPFRELLLLGKFPREKLEPVIASLEAAEKSSNPSQSGVLDTNKAYKVSYDLFRKAGMNHLDSKACAEDEVERLTKEWVGEVIAKRTLKPSTKNPEPSATGSKALSQCSDCNFHFNPSILWPIKQVDDDEAVTIKLCPKCYENGIKDDARIQRMFDTARMHMQEPGYNPTSEQPKIQ
jgi:hypothetical protein